MSSKPESPATISDRPSAHSTWQRRFFMVLTILGWLALAAAIIWGLAKIIGPLVLVGFSALLAYLIYLARQTLGLVFIAVFMAVALGPAVDFFSRHRVPRAVSILLVYFLIATAIFGIGLLVVPPIVSQVRSLAHDIPGYISKLRHNKQFRKYDNKYKITPKLQEEAKKLPSHLADAVSGLRSVTVGVFGKLIQLVTILVMTFFLLNDGKRIIAFAVRELGPERGERARRIGEDVYKAVG